jgi:hypothetical protein
MQKRDEITRRGIVMRHIIFLSAFILLLGLTVSYAQTKAIEGYKNIPWGTEFQKFKKLKKVKYNMGYSSNKFIEAHKVESVGYINDFLAYTLGVPTDVDNYRDEVFELEYVPRKFTTIYIILRVPYSKQKIN